MQALDDYGEQVHRELVKPPEHIDILHPWLARYHQSQLLRGTAYPGAASESISTEDKEVYGDSSHPVLFRIGNGGAGYTGVLKVLAECYIATHGGDFGIGWVANHSRHTQVALLGDVVQVALTYEPYNEEIAINERWCRRVCRALNDHFILVGGARNTAGVHVGDSAIEAMRTIAEHAQGEGHDTVFHTRKDGSATYQKEQELWRATGLEIQHDGWLQPYPLSPYDALVTAANTTSGGVYLLTDRATYLTAKQDGVIPDMRVYAEGGLELLNPCSALINTKVPASPSHRAAADFADWLSSQEAQDTIGDYGKDWSHGMPLFTVAAQDDFAERDRLTGSAL